MAEVLNRMGFRLRKVVKAKPQKKIAETDAIFANIEKKMTQAVSAGNVKRLSIDCKATVLIGEFSRGGLTRGDHQACDHDMGLHEKYIPCGIVDEDSAATDYHLWQLLQNERFHRRCARGLVGALM